MWGGVEEREKRQSLCTWYGSVLSCLSPEYCTSRGSLSCREKSFGRSVGSFLHMGGVHALDLILPPQFQPTPENPQAFAAGPFPCSQLSPLGRVPAPRHKPGFLPRHALGHRQLHASLSVQMVGGARWAAPRLCSAMANQFLSPAQSA